MHNQESVTSQNSPAWRLAKEPIAVYYVGPLCL